MYRVIASALVVAVCFAMTAVAQPPVSGSKSETSTETGEQYAVLNTNGGWCWYQDPRVIVDSNTGAVVFASCATKAGAEGDKRAGNVEVTTVDPKTGASKTAVVGNFPTGGGWGDDHDVAALWQRPDGRYLVVYTAHNHGQRDKNPKTFYRISTHPHDATQWQDEQAFAWPTDDPIGKGFIAVTYSNLHFLPAEGDKGRLYNIARASGQTWRIATSDDYGETWAYRGILTLPPAGGRAYSNGYPKFCDNGKDRIDFILTEAHPRDYNNGVYHGYIKDGQTHDAAGNVIDADTFDNTAPRPEQFTALFVPAEIAEGAYHTGWTTELIRDDDGQLHALFTCRVGTESVGKRNKTRNPQGDKDHRLFYARLDGKAWVKTELAKMGPGLYHYEEDYTGLGAIDPRDGKTVYISTPIDPHSGEKLKHHELFKGVTDDAGKTWQWTAVTEGSSADNLRPRLVLLDDDRLMLLWLCGSYPSMHRYEQQAVSRVVD